MARILIVEDDRDTRALLTRWLRALGHSTTECQDAESAFEALGTERFDALFVDVRLPGIDGYEFIRRVRAEGLSNAAVAIATITDREDLPDDVPVEAWLSKPFSRADVRRTIEAALRG